MFFLRKSFNRLTHFFTRRPQEHDKDVSEIIPPGLEKIEGGYRHTVSGISVKTNDPQLALNIALAASQRVPVISHRSNDGSITTKILTPRPENH
jgi:hypothetical protein